MGLLSSNLYFIMMISKTSPRGAWVFHENNPSCAWFQKKQVVFGSKKIQAVLGSKKKPSCAWFQKNLCLHSDSNERFSDRLTENHKKVKKNIFIIMLYFNILNKSLEKEKTSLYLLRC